MTTTTRQAPSTALRAGIVASLNVIKELDATDTPLERFAILHLGHPSDAKFGQVEHMTEAEYKRFVWLHTWPRPKGERG